MQNQTKKPIKDQFETQMKLMFNNDPDIVQEAAKHITKMIVEKALDIQSPENKEISKKITDKFLAEVGSQSFQVHSSVMRCLAQIVPNLPKQCLLHVFKVTISSIVDQQTQLKRREVFSSAAGQMIARAPSDIGNSISGLFVQCVTQFLRLQNRKNTKDQQQSIIHLINIIINFCSKWPDVIGNKQVNYDRQSLIHALLKNIQCHSKLQLISKSVVALQKIAGVFDHKNFQYVFNSNEVGILGFIRKFKKYTNQQNLKHLKNGVLALDYISRAHNRQMKPWAKQIATLCVELINQYKNFDIDQGSPELLYLVTETIQGSIDCLSSILKAYSSELGQWLGTGKFKYLSDFIDETLNYDPQRLMNYLSINEDNEYEQQEEEYYYSQGSVCWKVRQASLVYITMLMRRDHQFKQKKAKQPGFIDLLSNKLIEENQNVSKKAFACFNFIIQSISTTKVMKQAIQQQMSLKRVKSNQGNFALNLVDKIAQKIRILFQHKKTKQQAKTQASKTLLNIIQLLNQIIKDHQNTCSKVLDLIQELLPKVKSDSCINLIKSSKSLLNGNLPFSKVQNMIQVYLKLTKNNNFKISAASYDGLRNIIKSYPNQLLKTGKINDILSAILTKLKEHDADKLIKIHTIRCLRPIFQNIFAQLPENIQNDILGAAQTKLKVQIDKTTILSQFYYLPDNYQIKNSQQIIIKNMTQICSQSIGAVNYQLNNQAIQCCNKLIKLQKNTLNQKLIDSILNKSRAMLNDGKIPKFIGTIIDNYPNTLKPFAQAITKTGQSQYILKIIDKKIISIQQCIQILRGIASPDNVKKLALIVSKVNPNKVALLKQINDSNWGLVCLGALGYVGDIQTIDQINKLMVNKNHDFKFEGARAIGNIVSRNPAYSLKLIQLSSSPSEGYLYLQAIKQMLSFSNAQFPQLQKIIHFIFQKSEQSERQTNKHLLAQCLGNISRISPYQLERILKSTPEMSPNRKFIVASSLRYALENTNASTMDDERTEMYLQNVVNLTKDKEVNVRQGALRSLNSIVQTHVEQIRHLFDAAFMNNLLDSMTIKPELIKIVDYGVSKEKKDLGKPLRIEAFNFLRSIINIRQIQQYYDSIIAKCLDKINEQSSSDLMLKRINIIRVICEKDYTLFTPYQNDFSIKVGTTQGILKPYTTGVLAQDQRNEGYLKGIFKQVLQISLLSKQSSETIKAMINKIQTFQKLNKLLQIVKKN